MGRKICLNCGQKLRLGRTCPCSKKEEGGVEGLGKTHKMEGSEEEERTEKARSTTHGTSPSRSQGARTEEGEEGRKEGRSSKGQTERGGGKRDGALSH